APSSNPSTIETTTVPPPTAPTRRANRRRAGIHTSLGNSRGFSLGRRVARSRFPELVRCKRPALERVVARGDVPVAERVERWIDDVAVPCLEARTARMEVAGARRVQRAGHVALEPDRRP